MNNTDTTLTNSDEWFMDARNQTKDTLMDFINHVMNDYFHDYNTICQAISACMMATMSACDKYDCAGITGFQASAIMWEIVKHIHLGGNCGMRLIDYDDILFPQYDYKFDSTVIPKDIFSAIVDEARKRIADSENNNSYVHPKVLDRWKCLADGNVPNGFSVGD
jgi:hypothetical protein